MTSSLWCIYETSEITGVVCTPLQCHPGRDCCGEAAVEADKSWTLLLMPSQWSIDFSTIAAGNPAYNICAMRSSRTADLWHTGQSIFHSITLEDQAVIEVRFFFSVRWLLRWIAFDAQRQELIEVYLILYWIQASDAPNRCLVSNDGFFDNFRKQRNPLCVAINFDISDRRHSNSYRMAT